MLTRNRGKSKSVVASLGLLRKSKKRVSKEVDASSTKSKRHTSDVAPSLNSSDSVCKLESHHKSTLSALSEPASNVINASSITGEKTCTSSDKEALVVATPTKTGDLLPPLDSTEITSENTTPAESLSPLKSGDFNSHLQESVKCTLPPSGKSALRCLAGLPSAHAAVFRFFDDVLQEVLDEIGSTGTVFSSKRQFLLTKLPHRELIEKEKENALYVFGDPKLQNLFDKLAADQAIINEELDKKDAFLAAGNIVRPGVREAIRKRREEKHQQIKRGTIGRLRPNPRPRRFSDMVSPNVEIPVRFARFSRTEKRVRDRATKAAAKKLAQAKSQASYMLKTKTEAKRGRPRKSSCQKHESTKPIFMHTPMTTRPRRSVDIRHHIDWKFCYGGPSEKKLQRVELQSRKRRQPASSHESDEDEMDEAYGNEAEKEVEEDVKRERQLPSSPRSEVPSSEADNPLASKVDDLTLDQLSQKGAFAAEAAAEPKKRSHSILFKRKRQSNTSLGSNTRTSRVESACSPRTRSSSSDSSNAFSGAAKYYSRASAYKSPDPTFVPHQRKKRDRFSGRPPRTLNDSVGEAGGDSRRSSHHKHESHRRLTLLDRVVLGLTCSVVQEGEEIHIKQLHSDDLNILTQRLNETGFFIKSLALKTNANNDAEYNIVLTYAPKLEVSMRQVRKYSPASASFHPAIDYGSVVPLKKARMLPPAYSGTHSDNESRGKRASGDSPPLIRPSSTMDFSRAKIYVAARRRGGVGVEPSRPKFHHPLQRLSMRNLTAVGPTSAFVRRPRSRDNAEEASEGESVSPVVPIGGLGFRRHSPRKVIRKVYTGTSTVPKILNRKRLMVSGAAYPTPSQAPSAPPPTPSEDTMLENRSQKMFYQVSTGSTPEPLVTESAVAATAEPQTDQSNVSVSGAALISTVEPPAPSSVVIESSKSAAVATSEVATPVTTSTTSVPTASEDNQNNPANSMSASQLLRLKRLHDDQPQLSTATPTSAEPLHQPSQAPKLPAPSHTKFPAADPSAGAVCQAQQLPHSVEVVVPPAVGGSASGGGDDDGTDFELNSLLHLQRPVRNAPGQQLAEHYRLLQGAHLLAGHKAVAHPVKSGPPPAFLQQQRRFNHPPPGMLQYVATTGFPQPPVKRPVIPTLTTTAAAATPPRPFDSSTNSLLTGRSVVSTTTVVTSAASTATPRRPIVHKYHSFRKISPKHQSTAAATAATGNRPASTTVSKPASSQLLKSLLESGGGSSLPRTPSTAAAVPMVTAAPATTTFNQPAHQSRGTWQLGGRAIVLGASITTPSTPLSSSAHRLQAASQPAPALTSPKTDVIPSDSVPQAVLHENDKPETRQDSTETVGS